MRPAAAATVAAFASVVGRALASAPAAADAVPGVFAPTAASASQIFSHDLITCRAPFGSDVAANVWFCLAVVSFLVTMLIFYCLHIPRNSYISPSSVDLSSGWMPRPASAVAPPPGVERPRLTLGVDPDADPEAVTAAAAAQAAASVSAQLAARTPPSVSDPVPRCTVKIFPEGTRYDPGVSAIYLGARDNAAIRAHGLTADGHLQRGVPITRTAYRDGHIFLLFLAFAELILVVATLGPLFFNKIHLRDEIGRIDWSVTTFPGDFFWLHAVFILLGIPAFAALQHLGGAMVRRARRLPLWPTAVASFLSVPATAMLVYFTMRAFDASVGWNHALTHNSASPPVSGARGAVYTFAFGCLYVVVFAWLMITLSRTTGLALANPAAVRDPGLPIDFNEDYQLLLIEYLQRTEMNVHPERARGLSLVDIAARRRHIHRAHALGHYGAGHHRGASISVTEPASPH